MPRSTCVVTLSALLLLAGSSCDKGDETKDATRPAVRSPAQGAKEAPARAAEPNWQELADSALAQAGEAGAIVVLDPKDGSLLGLAQKNGQASNPANVARHPASSVKPFLALAALAEGKLNPVETVTCDGPRQIDGETFTCFHDHGEIALERSLRTSCNHFAYEIATRLSPEAIAKHFRGFGLGKASGLLPKSLGDEETGRVPEGPGKLAASIGHGELVATPLQIAKAYAALATGRIPARVDAPLDYRQSQLDHVRRALVSTVENPEGSGHASRVAGLKIAGKTGTAELPDPTAEGFQYLSWFAGWAPADDPQVVVVVQLESKKTAGASAAPAAKRVFEALVADGTDSK